jgi:glycine cleavage system H lipoate-binding protein/TusA-related sulfurtransferase
LKIKDCNFADDVLYHVDSNTWVSIAGEVVTIGINTILAWAFGAFSSTSFKSVGTTIVGGESLGSIEGPRHFDVVRSPLSGILLETNEGLRGDPRLLNKDPYGRGWFAKLRPSNLHEESRNLRALASATKELGDKLTEMKVRCFQEFPDYEMYEIGTECSAVLAKLDELIEREPDGTVVHVVSDDPTAGIEMVRWSERSGNSLVEERREGNLEHFIVRKR